MHTQPGFPKKVCIQIYHIPSGTTYQSDGGKVYDQDALDDNEDLCRLFTNKNAVNCKVKIHGIDTFFPIGVLQQSIISLIVTPRLKNKSLTSGKSP